MRGGGEDFLSAIVVQHQILGARRFFVSPEEMTTLLRNVLRQTTRPRLSLNRPQIGGNGFVHRVEWLGLTFTSVSHSLIVVA